MDVETALSELGLSANEAEIYENLLKEGESSVGDITKNTAIHRRNIYDVLNRLIEKGLVIEVVDNKENFYQPVDPHKLMEFIHQQEESLVNIMPDLRKMYDQKPEHNQAFVYRGISGWKNYMRDILRIGEDVHIIATKGAWLDPQFESFFAWFWKEAKRKKIKFKFLLDAEVIEKKHAILKYIKSDYKIIPKKYSTATSVDVFGDHVIIASSFKDGSLSDDFMVTSIIDKNLAASFRIWFDFMWTFCPEGSA